MSAENAKRFRIDAIEQLDHLILGERQAKLGLVLATLGQFNMVSVGVPGGGKTTFGELAYQLVDGILPENVASIPALADITPKQVVGGRSVSSKTVKVPELVRHDGTTVEAHEYTETTVVDTPGIIKPSTQWMFMNEMNRTAPHAVNAFLDVIERRTITNTSGVYKVPDLQIAVANMNPAEDTSKTFRLDHAIASRFPVGVILGAPVDIDENNKPQLTSEQDMQVEELFDSWNPSDSIDPVITLEELNALRKEASTIEVTDKFVRDIGKPAVAHIMHELANLDQPEAVGRMTRQLGKMVRILAMMGGGKEVLPEHMAEAVDFQMTARIGLLKKDAVKKTPDVVNRILDNIGIQRAA